MNKLTDIDDGFMNNFQGMSLEEAMDKHDAFVSHIEATNASRSKLGWNLNSLYVNYAQQNTLYRKSTSANDSKVALWLAKAQEKAKLFYIEHSGMPDFFGLYQDDVKEIARLSVHEDIFAELPDILAFKGIILVYLPALDGSKIDGASFLLAGKIPVIAHAVRFNRLDNFWFTLIHELSHICLHFDHLSTPIVDEDIWHEDTESPLYDMEIEADRLTRFSFIPKNEWRTTPRRLEKIESINEIADRNKVHPATIAGLIRHASNDYKLFSGLIHSVDVHRMIFNQCS